MIRAALALLVWLAATTLAAQSLPDRYMVQGVAKDDTLNIRAEPNARSEIIGEFGPFDLNVEVMREQDGWGYTGAGERSGWVSMRFLTPNPVPPHEVPRPMICSGTEPFWSVSFHPRGTEYNAPGEERRRLTILHERTARTGYLVEAEEGPALTRTMIINARPCNDGMSDREFAMAITMFTDAPDGSEVWTGCCTMQVNN
ncbi:hypothetical protein [Thalassorhabdomicrobium marinisediminis]|uniref:hypothetical protein n=1 Tax=Thalassorhabdomicrobium marinisediminis TaxID=2170577 RepID=UPI0024911460|nr:hypothetical protein [Thalassorhabdomicrobium marinisediminis]